MKNVVTLLLSLSFLTAGSAIACGEHDGAKGSGKCDNKASAGSKPAESKAADTKAAEPVQTAPATETAAPKTEAK